MSVNRYSRISLILLSIILFCTVSFAQEKNLSYYNKHSSEILPDARAAFKKGEYQRTVDLCDWYFVIEGGSAANELKSKASRCVTLSADMKKLQAGGDIIAAGKKAKDILALNPDDPAARKISADASSTSATVPSGMTGDAAKYYSAAVKGDAVAQYYLGSAYERGKGIVKDNAEAVKWYRKSAEQGHVEAQYAMGLCYDFARGVAQNYPEAASWYKKAADQGKVDAQYRYGEVLKMHLKDTLEGVKWIRKAADRGSMLAQRSLGSCYENATGVNRDMGEAVKWFRLAAEQGDTWAQNHLGIVYETGRGVKQDYAEAVKWYRKCADQGYGPGQRNLGLCYENGHGVAQNFAEAKRWYEMSIKSGNTSAQRDLDRLAGK